MNIFPAVTFSENSSYTSLNNSLDIKFKIDQHAHLTQLEANNQCLFLSCHPYIRGSGCFNSSFRVNVWKERLIHCKVKVIGRIHYWTPRSAVRVDLIYHTGGILLQIPLTPGGALAREEGKRPAWGAAPQRVARACKSDNLRSPPRDYTKK